MGATYTRQSTYSDGDVITAAHTNDEFNQLLAAFQASTGHTHDGTDNEGGPITITHPEMTRYFMSIQEASQLILQCGALGIDGEIFLLEMGQPIRIVQMAKDLIRLSGLEPEEDIPIVFTGLRPGEKLFEELQLLNEQKVSTSHKKIMILKDNNAHISWPIFKTNIDKLLSFADKLDSENIQILLKSILPTYSPRSNYGQNFEQKNTISRTSIEAKA